MERQKFALLFRWSVSIGIDDAARDHSVFSENREGLLEGRRHRSEVVGRRSGSAVREGAFGHGSLLDRRHADRSLGVDEELQAEDGSDKPPANGGGRNRETDFHGEKRSNDTRASTTARRRSSIAKGRARKPSSVLWGTPLMENRKGRVVDARLAQADGHAELQMMGRSRAPAGGDHSGRRQSLCTPRILSTNCARRK